MNARRAIIPSALDQDILSWAAPIANFTPNRHAMLVPVPGTKSSFAGRDIYSHVLLAACMPNQKAHEHQFKFLLQNETKTLWCGVFTHYLMKYMEQVSETTIPWPMKGITYASMMNEMWKSQPEDNTAEIIETQTPLCIGAHRNRYIFTQSEHTPAQGTFSIHFCENTGELYVQAGYSHGVTYHTQFVVDGSPSNDVLDPDYYGMVLCIKEIQDNHSIVLPENTYYYHLHPGALSHAWAIAVTEGALSTIMKVLSFYPVFEHTQGLYAYALVSPFGMYYDISLQQAGKGWILHRLDPLTFQYAQSVIIIQEELTHPGECLSKISCWNFYLYLSNGHSREIVHSRRAIVELHHVAMQPLLSAESTQGLHIIQPQRPKKSPNILIGSSKEVPCHPNSSYRVKDEVHEAHIYNLRQYYGLTLTNHSQNDLYVYVLYFNPSTYDIHVS